MFHENDSGASTGETEVKLSVLGGSQQRVFSGMAGKERTSGRSMVGSKDISFIERELKRHH
jgi:hypothetical protein